MENRTNTGVYKIYFKGSKDWGYIGSSMNLKNRRHNHLHFLKNNKHPNTNLQDAYNKYGLSNLDFFVIEYLPDDIVKDELESVEQYWIDTAGFDNLYNLCPNAADSTGLKHDEETKQKISEASIRFHQENPDFMKGENHPNYGKSTPDETKLKLSEARIRFYQENPDFNKGENHPNYGKPAHNRITDVWDRYDWIKDLHIATGWGYIRICKAYNQEFSTNHKYPAFMNILKKIKEEISTN
jgi:group I intron endonuclease